MGKLCESELSPRVSRIVERAYSRAYDVNMEEVAARGGPYASFDEFFTRPLKPGARPVSEDAVVSPADGRLESTGPVEPSGRIFVKGRPYEVGELLGSPTEAAPFAGGSFAVVYLSPRDYHRVHCPVDGDVGLVRGIPGDLFPVNSIGERHVPRLFVRNNRVVIYIDTPGLGRVALIMVGAIVVGRISVTLVPGPAVPAGDHALSPRASVARGDELGMFHLGSTAVMLLEPGLQIVRKTGPILYGQSLLRVA
ncbi:MAG: archaetidylserine decarboxylase [Polyangiaceae bacterium]